MSDTNTAPSDGTTSPANHPRSSRAKWSLREPWANLRRRTLDMLHAWAGVDRASVGGDGASVDQHAAALEHALARLDDVDGRLAQHRATRPPITAARKEAVECRSRLIQQWRVFAGRRAAAPGSAEHRYFRDANTSSLLGSLATLLIALESVAPRDPLLLKAHDSASAARERLLQASTNTDHEQMLADLRAERDRLRLEFESCYRHFCIGAFNRLHDDRVRAARYRVNKPVTAKAAEVHA